MDHSLPGSSVRGILRQEYQSGLQRPSPGDLPDPLSLSSPALAGGFFTTSATWDANYSFHIYRLCPKSNFFSAYQLLEPKVL